MTVTCLLFASLAEKAGKKQIQFALEPGLTAEGLFDKLAADYFPSEEKLRSVLMYAIGSDFVEKTRVLQNGDVVAFIPPVAGG